jgi:hypothetical protein
MRLRIALLIVTLGALNALGFAVHNKLNAADQEVADRRAAAARQVHDQAQQYAVALAAEPQPPSDARLAELGESLDIQVIGLRRAPTLTVEIRSRAQYSVGGAGSSLVEACYTVSSAALTQLPNCPTIAPIDTPPSSS